MYRLKGAMLAFTGEGSIYKLSCRYLTPDDVIGLERAAARGSDVRLVFPDGTIVLTAIKLKFLGDGWTSIEGRLVGTVSKHD